MSNVNRRDMVKLGAGLAIGAGLVPNTAIAQDAKSERPDLDAVLKVQADAKRGISIRFELPGKKDQSLSSEEYRYAVLDKDGVQVKGGLEDLALAVHTTHLPKGERSVSDYADCMFDSRVLKSGKEYFLVLSVRNLTALAKFTAQ